MVVNGRQTIDRIVANGVLLLATAGQVVGVAVRGLKPKAVVAVGSPDPFPLTYR